MKKTQTKDTTAKIILSLVLLFLGEGLLNFGLYWPVIISLGFESKRVYWYGLVFGILVSIVTKGNLGLPSLLIVLAIFLMERLRGLIRTNVWLIGLGLVLINFVGDKIIGLSWTIPEAMVVFTMTMLLFNLEFFNDDLHLSGQ